MEHININGNLFRCQRRWMRKVDRSGFGPAHLVGKSCHLFRNTLRQGLLGVEQIVNQWIDHIRFHFIGNDLGVQDAGDRRQLLKADLLPCFMLERPRISGCPSSEVSAFRSVFSVPKHHLKARCCSAVM